MRCLCSWTSEMLVISQLRHGALAYYHIFSIRWTPIGPISLLYKKGEKLARSLIYHWWCYLVCSLIVTMWSVAQLTTRNLHVWWAFEYPIYPPPPTITTSCHLDSALMLELLVHHVGGRSFLQCKMCITCEISNLKECHYIIPLNIVKNVEICVKAWVLNVNLRYTIHCNMLGIVSNQLFIVCQCYTKQYCKEYNMCVKWETLSNKSFTYNFFTVQDSHSCRHIPKIKFQPFSPSQDYTAHESF